MIITHCIIMSSSYSKGARIAIDYCLKPTDTKEVLLERLNKITDACGNDVSISTHYIPTASKSWTSVYKKDPFFEDVKLINSIDTFIKLIQKDRLLKGIDVAKYILSKVKCTHLKLEKLVYLCYAEYLCQTGKRLFQDEIYAFKLGPVVESVYKIYKGYEKLPEEKEINSNGISEMPTKSRIMFAQLGLEKSFSIDKTLDKYSEYNASKLVDITHGNNTPWKMTYEENTKYKKILDETIIKFHKNEIL